MTSPVKPTTDAKRYDCNCHEGYGCMGESEKGAYVHYMSYRVLVNQLAAAIEDSARAENAMYEQIASVKLWQEKYIAAESRATAAEERARVAEEREAEMRRTALKYGIQRDESLERERALTLSLEEMKRNSVIREAEDVFIKKFRESFGEKGMVESLVDAFLSWELPESVYCDPCVTMTAKEYPHKRYGTSLLTATVARMMIAHLMSAAVSYTARSRRSHEGKNTTDGGGR